MYVVGFVHALFQNRGSVGSSSQHVHCTFVPWHSLLVLSSRRRSKNSSSRMSVLDYHAPVFHITTASSTICRRRTTSERRSVYIRIYMYIVWPQLSSSRESEPRVEAHNMASSTFSRGPTASSHYYSGH